MNILNLAIVGLAGLWRRPIIRILSAIVILLIIVVATFPLWQKYLPPIESQTKAQREIVLERSLLQITLIIAKPDTLRQMVEATGAELLSREITEGGFEDGRLLDILRSGEFDLNIKADMDISSPDPFVKAPSLPMKQDISVQPGRVEVVTYLDRPTSVLQNSRLVLLFTEGEGDRTILTASLELDVSIRHLPFTGGIVDSRVAAAAQKQLDAEIDCLAEIVAATPKIPVTGLKKIGSAIQGFLEQRREAREED